MRLTGVKFVDIQPNIGRVRAKDGTVNLDFGGSEGVTQMANGRPAGVIRRGKASRLEVTVIHAADIDENEYNKQVPRTITVQTDTGRAYLMANAERIDTLKLNGDEGEFPIVFEGDEVEVIQ